MFDLLHDVVAEFVDQLYYFISSDVFWYSVFFIFFSRFVFILLRLLFGYRYSRPYRKSEPEKSESVKVDLSKNGKK